VSWSLVRTVAPTSDPVTVQEMREHARISLTDDDSHIQGLIASAVTYAETFLNRQIMTATYRLSMDGFPSWIIKLPMPPTQSVTSITYVDSGGTTTTLAGSTYILDSDSSPARITPAYSTIWPSIRSQIGSVKVTFVAGYASAALVPAPITHAIRMLVAHWYENREAVSTGAVSKAVEMSVFDLLSSERILDFSGPFGSQN
jgi:uncharacterized phiE125 gp8 family phage protein